MSKNNILKKAVYDGKGGPLDSLESFTGGKEIMQKIIPGGKDPSWKDVGEDAIDVGGTALSAFGAGLGLKGLKAVSLANKANKAGKFGKVGKYAPKVGVKVGPAVRNIVKAARTKMATPSLGRLAEPVIGAAKKTVSSLPTKPGAIIPAVGSTLKKAEVIARPLTGPLSAAAKTATNAVKSAGVSAAATAKKPGLLRKIVKGTISTAGKAAKGTLKGASSVVEGAGKLIKKAPKPGALPVIPF